jgi:hypothetical protein
MRLQRNGFSDRQDIVDAEVEGADPIGAGFEQQLRGSIQQYTG